MGGLRGSRAYMLRTDGGDPLLTFRTPHGPTENCALVIDVHEATTAPTWVRLAVSGEAVEEIHALTSLILAGPPCAEILCGFAWSYNGLSFSCGLEDGHPSPLAFSGGELFHVSSEGQPYEEPPF